MYKGLISIHFPSRTCRPSYPMIYFISMGSTSVGTKQSSTLGHCPSFTTLFLALFICYSWPSAACNACPARSAPQPPRTRCCAESHPKIDNLFSLNFFCMIHIHEILLFGYTFMYEKCLMCSKLRSSDYTSDNQICLHCNIED